MEKILIVSLEALVPKGASAQDPNLSFEITVLEMFTIPSVLPKCIVDVVPGLIEA